MVLALVLGVGGGILVLNGLFGSVADGMPEVSPDCEEANNCLFEGVLFGFLVLMGGMLQFLGIAVPCTIAAVILLILGIRHLVRAYEKPAVSTGRVADDVDIAGLPFLGGGVALLGPPITLLLFYFTPEIII